jgi:hypothetical protein
MSEKAKSAVFDKIGWGHDWPSVSNKDINATEEICKSFFNHPLNEKSHHKLPKYIEVAEDSTSEYRRKCHP